ncbi:hypothetical protein J1N35_015294 [Gossypium stocksii]|uniref:Uncharacterized protein n=1 Tax=Gossypium stocksii TaxID=47602 RepID=A0A9D4A8F8_9ROSI|nr:hypothetical protein J1N35_015294 [Gossypium stocksii]
MFKHDHRPMNGVAHLLAIEGLKNGEQRFMINRVTGYAEEAVEKDRRGVVLPE